MAIREQSFCKFAESTVERSEKECRIRFDFFSYLFSCDHRLDLQLIGDIFAEKLPEFISCLLLFSKNNSEQSLVNRSRHGKQIWLK